MSSYKSEKEAFVSHMTGSSIAHVNAISSVALFSIVLYSALQSRSLLFAPQRSESLATSALHFLSEAAVLVAPVVLSITLAADMPLTLAILLGLPASAANLALPTLSPVAPVMSSTTVITPLPFISVYRAHMMLLTILCILAVDFPVFPRSLAKCETFGVSLVRMDMGVGSFVFSQGLVSAIPLLKNPSHLSAPLFPKLAESLRKVWPVLLLGLVRVVLVKGTEYPEHVSEYGVHWNFFITLGLLPPLSVLLHPLITHMPIALIGLLITLAHQVLLSGTQLQSWAIGPERVGLLGMNKEGIISMAGYLAIHFLGLSTGTYLLPPDPSQFRRHQRASSTPEPPSFFGPSTTRQHGKIAIELCSYTVVWWSLLGAVTLVMGHNAVSRRLANLPYVLWVVAFNTLFLLGYLLVDNAFSPPPYLPHFSHLPPINTTLMLEEPVRTAPVLLEAINLNALPLFLLANVMTGVINMSMQTMYASKALALSVIGAYVGVMCAVAWVGRERRWVRL
ncbi:hypothetical protein BOTBODRAFT_117080 [Botryobasidium botryosum FD-172 SS1]|uniref:GPI-anchored wall transfer protein n=1 Tax=Botryobasidium botryosum (strain FD-172 SS1) TaxID=930990 RepID=A0A067MD62_BOTB1|nr:hypothetical protein BOTBODRAFT_117080 [Botryobasidium botryosum FD-172 SS1]